MSQPKGTVLVVDDVEDGRMLMNALLDASGYDVIEAQNGTEALAHLDESPDLILLDVHLPDIDGFEVCRRIKADPGSALTPVVMVSAVFSQTEHRVRGLSGGGDAYLAKPFEPELLVATVEALMRHRATEQALAYRNRLLRLDYELTRMLAEPACVAGDATGILQTVAEALEADMAEFWRVEPHDNVLIRASAWQSHDVDGTALDRAAAAMRVRYGLDASGTFSDDATGEWRDALSSGSRAEIVAATGLRSATVIPVLTCGTVAGAFVLFHRRRQRAESGARRLVTDVRDRLWHFLDHPGVAQAVGLVKEESGSATVDTGRLVYHELRNLLFVIGGHAELLVETLPPDIKRRQDLVTIIGATRRATALLERTRRQMMQAGVPPTA